MSSIDVLKALLSRHLFDTQNLIDEYGGVERKTKALTESIDALEKVGHVQAIINHLGLITIPPHPIDDPDSHAEAFNEALYQVSSFIDSLDKSDSTTN